MTESVDEDDDDTMLIFIEVPLAGGRSGRKVVSNQLQRRRRNPPAHRPACGRYEKFFATNCEGRGRLLISVYSTGEGQDRARWQVGDDVCSEVL